MGKLTVNRRAGESIIIGNSIHIKVKVDDYGNPKLEITAPNDVKILREEILSDEQKELCRQNGLPL
ncbi:carbon storage regulator (plasmid) [Paenibacillus urinalis]|uniref:Carbon storage regulator n=1 Tax=Paenibacillus urinalis TaxID=521520 RepID=A0ABY7XGP9_9BACL|nr:carbon storage regulator [Paenibacillus urinalis]WDI05031.1 carbon storage regulator [Paenibacillus urinalis]